MLVELPLAPALAAPPPPPPFEPPLELLEAEAEPLGPEDDALERLPLVLVAVPAARAASPKAISEISAADVTKDSLVIEVDFIVKLPWSFLSRERQ